MLHFFFLYLLDFTNGKYRQLQKVSCMTSLCMMFLKAYNNCQNSGINIMTCCYSSQGSTLRKRKMYEEFLSKVSILGKAHCFFSSLTFPL